MSQTRIYQPINLTVETTVPLDEKASHHLSRVLRASKGESLILFNGDGHDYGATITQIDKKHVEVMIHTATARVTESPVEIYLAQGIARGEKMDTIVQKAVELGVTKLFPLITERCNVRLDAEREAKRLQHWRSIAISACEQSGRNRIPDVAAPQSLTTWLAGIKADLRFVLSPHVTPKLIAPTTPPRSVALLIGPEGGLTDPEVAEALSQGFLPLNVGPRVLRTETATLAALTIMQYEFGDL